MRMRKTAPGDLPALKALWAQAFGDTEAEIDAFFETLYPEALGFCAEEDGQPAAMLYALPVTAVHDETAVRAAYLYAVATEEAHRGCGICRALMAFAERELQKRYFSCLLLVPADERLAQYYESLGYARQTGCTVRHLRVDAPKGRALPVSVPDYAGLRETMLFDVPHVRYPKAMLDYEAARAKLYRLELGYDLGCAAVSVQDGTAVVEELLPDLRMLPALAAEVPAERYLVRTPGHDGLSCMTKWLDKAAFGPIWLAFPFD